MTKTSQFLMANMALLCIYSNVSDTMGMVYYLNDWHKDVSSDGEIKH